jgi:hypothetical protein
LFFHGQEAEPAAKLGKEVGKTKRRMGSKYAFRLRVSPRKQMRSCGLEPTVNRTITEQLLGFHKWLMTPQAKRTLLETTLPNAKIINPETGALNRFSRQVAKLIEILN